MNLTNKEKGFMQGYVCACVAFIRIVGEHTNMTETFQAGVGNVSLNDLRDLYGIDQNDIDFLNEHPYLFKTK